MGQKRTDQTFSHERTMRDVALAREQIDKTLDTGEQLLQLLINVQPCIVFKETENADVEFDRAVVLSGEMGQHIRRVMLRLRRRDGIVKALMAYKASLDEGTKWLEELYSKDLAVDQEQWRAKVSAMGANQAKVIDITVSRIGTNIAE